MKIAVVMGSPRKKDSYQICKLIENQMAGIAEFEYIYLKDYEIADCKGCDQCFQKGENFCPNKDDLNAIKEKLVHADGIIFASPVYAYQVPAPLKRLIDRLSYFFHRQELVGIPVLIVVSTGGGGQKQVSKYLKMTVSGWGCRLAGTIPVISPMFFESNGKTSAWGYDESYHKSTLKRIGKTCAAFTKMITDTNPVSPTFYDVFMFHCLRTKTFISQIDYDFWKSKNWLESDYFYEVKIGFLKKCFGSVLRKCIDAMGKKLKNNTIK